MISPLFVSAAKSGLLIHRAIFFTCSRRAPSSFPRRRFENLTGCSPLADTRTMPPSDMPLSCTPLCAITSPFQSYLSLLVGDSIRCLRSAFVPPFWAVLISSNGATPPPALFAMLLAYLPSNLLVFRAELVSGVSKLSIQLPPPWSRHREVPLFTAPNCYSL